MCSAQCLVHTGFAPAHGVCAFPVYTAQAPGCSAGNCLKWALSCVYFPGLSHSCLGSRVLHKGTDSVRPAFLCPSQVQAAQATRSLASALSQVCDESYHLPGPSCLVSPVHSKSTVSGVLCVFSGEMIPGCDPPSRCQPSRIPGRLG